MSTPTPRPSSTAADRSVLLLRLLAVAGLCVSAYVHLDLASGPLHADGEVTLAGLFVADAVAALVVALWLGVRSGLLVCLVAGAVALASLSALVVAVHVEVPAIGPLPTVYEPLWYAEKVVAAVAAAVAAAGALTAAALLRRGAAVHVPLTVPSDPAAAPPRPDIDAVGALDRRSHEEYERRPDDHPAVPDRRRLR